MALKDIFEGNTAGVNTATGLLDMLNDRKGQFVWKQLTAEGGDFMAYVTADDETSYPDGGMQDGYWYERGEGVNIAQLFGLTKMAVDEFAFSAGITNQYMQSDYNKCVIPHSLGELPKITFVLCDTSDKLNGLCFTGSFTSGNGEDYIHQLTISSLYSFYYNEKVNIYRDNDSMYGYVSKVTDSTVKLVAAFSSSSYNSVVIPAGRKYYLITMA